MKHQKVLPGFRGQGLVEYALILVLVAIVTILVLVLLGPTVGNVFSKIASNVQSAAIPGGGSGGGGGGGSEGGGETEGNVITGLSASRTGGGSGNSVKVDITVSSATTVTIKDSQSGASHIITCGGNCSVTLSNVGKNAGVITASAKGNTTTTSYPARK